MPLNNILDNFTSIDERLAALGRGSNNIIAAGLNLNPLLFPPAGAEPKIISSEYTTTAQLAEALSEKERAIPAGYYFIPNYLFVVASSDSSTLSHDIRKGSDPLIPTAILDQTDFGTISQPWVFPVPPKLSGTLSWKIKENGSAQTVHPTMVGWQIEKDLYEQAGGA